MMKNNKIYSCFLAFVMAYISLVASVTDAAGGSSSRSSNSHPFKLGVRDSFMIAHSFRKNPAFGPAQNLHGATYTVDIEFQSSKLHPKNNWVLDIGKALDIINRVLQKYNLKNLDDVFPDETVMTTTEFMCQQIHQDICMLLKEEGCVDDDNMGDFVSDGWICVTLAESFKAWASFDGPVSSPDVI